MNNFPTGKSVYPRGINKMRKEMPQYGDKRIIKKFLLLPKTIDYERRWLENAEIEQYFDRYARMWKSYKWVNQ